MTDPQADRAQLLEVLEKLDACTDALEHIQDSIWVEGEVDLRYVWRLMAVNWQFWYLFRYGWDDPREVAAGLFELCGNLDKSNPFVDFGAYANAIRTGGLYPGTNCPWVTHLVVSLEAGASPYRLACRGDDLASKYLPGEQEADHLTREALQVWMDLRFPFDKIRKPADYLAQQPAEP